MHWCSGDHRLKHRPRRIARQRTVQKGTARLLKACGKVPGVVGGHADPCPDGGGGHIQHQNAPGSHILCRHRLCCPLHRAGDGQLHPCSTAVLPYPFRLLPGTEGPPGSDTAADHVLCAGAGKHLVQCLFQSGGTLALAVQIADEVAAQGCGGVALRRRIAPEPQCGKVSVHLQQKGGRAAAVPVQQRLPLGVCEIVKPGVAVFPREAQRLPPLFHTGEQQSIAVVKIAPPGRQGQRHSGLCRCMGGVTVVLRQCIEPAQHHPKTQQQRRIQPKDPSACHKNAPFPPSMERRGQGYTLPV